MIGTVEYVLVARMSLLPLITLATLRACTLLSIGSVSRRSLRVSPRARSNFGQLHLWSLLTYPQAETGCQIVASNCTEYI